jgi:hypothetical protein
VEARGESPISRYKKVSGQNQRRPSSPLPVELLRFALALYPLRMMWCISFLYYVLCTWFYVEYTWAFKKKKSPTFSRKKNSRITFHGKQLQRLQRYKNSLNIKTHWRIHTYRVRRFPRKGNMCTDVPSPSGDQTPVRIISQGTKWWAPFCQSNPIQITQPPLLTYSLIPLVQQSARFDIVYNQ